jgi:hypothetical protein
MINLRVRTVISPAELDAKLGRVLTPDDYNVLLTGPATVWKHDGTLLCVYLPKAVSGDAARLAWPALHSMAYLLTDNRGLAAGSGRVQRGSQQRTRSKNVPSAIVGAIDPSPTHRYCRLTKWTRDHLPDMPALLPMLDQIGACFAQHVPDRYAVQMGHIKATRPEWRIGSTPFTTLTVNNTYPTGVHTDKGDLAAGFSAVTVLRKASYEGCELVFPRYRVGVNLGNRDLLLMDAHEWHGNTAFRTRDPGAERISVVCYYRTKMAACASAEAEEAKAHAAAARKSGMVMHG